VSLAVLPFMQYWQRCKRERANDLGSKRRGQEKGTDSRRYDIPAEIATLSSLWPGIVKKHRLNVPEDLHRLLGTSLQIGHAWAADVSPDNLFAAGVESTIKLRRAGFHGCIDSRKMFVKHLRRMQDLRMIPQ
jgi:hypothetical protein